MGLLTCLFAGALLLCAAVAGVAQTEAPVKTQAETEAVPAPPPPSPTAWGLGPVNVSGLVDGYYSLGFNHPAGNVSVLRNFDDKANQPELNMAMLTLDVAPKPVGAHVDVGFGRVFDMISATEKDVTPMRFFKQAYISLKPGSWKGVQLDFGRFATSAGAEVIDSAGNFNYSRSLLFAWCEPYYHFGMRASAPIGKEFTAGLQWVAGWNNIVTGSVRANMNGVVPPDEQLLFRNIITADDYEHGKPRPDPYDIAVMQSGFNRNQGSVIAV